jgi:hypothetical protein
MTEREKETQTERSTFTEINIGVCIFRHIVLNIKSLRTAPPNVWI